MQVCPNCGYSNRPGGVFCENCGATLIGSASPLKTRALGSEKPTSTLEPDSVARAVETVTPDFDLIGEQGAEEFPEEAALRLEVGEGTKPIIIDVKDAIVVFGRRDAATGSAPDIDLTPYAGYRMGVSRRHAEVRRDAENYNRVTLWDLGSSNGTFLNGDRLIAHRAYIIHNGDQLRFGQLSIRVYFQKKMSHDPSVTEDISVTIKKAPEDKAAADKETSPPPSEA
jgi:pSer/pThr/pTyr-binding forkhead associated (FHA) protein